MNLARFRGRILLSLAFGVLVLLALLVYGDLSETVAAISRFQVGLLPAIIGLTLANYVIRFGKWHYYIRLLGARTVAPLDSLLIFFSGLSMTITPGKVGEWLKCYLLQQQSGIQFSRAAPIIIAERLTDGLALLILASAGIVVFGLGFEVMVGTLLLAAMVLLLSQYPPLAVAVLALAERLPLIRTRAHHLRHFYEGSAVLFRGPSFGFGIALGVLSWAGECVAFFLVLAGLGLEPSGMLLLQASFILAVSSLAGGLFLTPGGLGVAEGGIAALTRLLVGAPSDVTAAATILIRACTLWFGVAVGAGALFVYSQWRFTRLGLAAPTADPSP
ncbi:MAG: lysylphosphatidylglycerol synthase transmembrane domain-containing protein [Chloroflexota bacterium]|nr:flippase-like domain-containing protein [Dehalococcoidia bacterium]MDW8253650.1 lysylphosphatidylglycerol synthase transmembrane domain-containing protein [Chloroflexota bacterium]